jgi:alanine dehydrogenase
MVIGILKERFEDEQRIALSPFGVEALVSAGAQVVVESDAGLAARFPNDQYQQAGAMIVYSAEEAAGRSDLVMKVMPPQKGEFDYFVEGKAVMCHLLLGMGQRPLIDMMMEKRMTAIGMELLQARDGSFPILRLMSEISGQVCAQIAARLLRSDQGGRGILLGGLAGVAPAAVVILGAGASGFSAAQAVLGLGGQVILLDNDLEKLRQADTYFGKRVTTVIASPENIRRGVRIADVFIGAISISDEGSHHIVSEEMVKTMKPGAVIIDVSINQGGCVETSRPTTIREPRFVKHDVIHYCVPNIPSVVARTSTYALTNGLLPYLLRITQNGLDDSIANDVALRSGVAIYRGKAWHAIINEIFGIESVPFDGAIPS